jgi:hypothetical protein
MYPKGLLQCCQDPVIRPCPDADELVHILTSYFLKVHFNIILTPPSRSTKESSFMAF